MVPPGDKWEGRRGMNMECDDFTMLEGRKKKHGGQPRKKQRSLVRERDRRERERDKDGERERDR